MKNKRLHLREEANIFHLELIAAPANPTDYLFFQELADIIPKLSTSKVRGLIIYGRGRHFSSGANINELKNLVLQNSHQAAQKLMSQSVDLFYKISRLPYPVIAAIQGCCMGSGLELALSCHYRIATKSGLFSLPETTFDLMPGCGGTVRLPTLIGLAKTVELILSGDSFLAADAITLGLIDRIVDKKHLIETGKKMINTLHSFTLAHSLSTTK